MDLGKAIAINPSNAGNYFLRGDCHCKLGSYEQVNLRNLGNICFSPNMQALSDYNLAESKGFEDMCALLLSRGSVKRLLQHVKGALDDFTSACTLLVKGDHVSPAVCLIWFSTKIFVAVEQSPNSVILRILPDRPARVRRGDGSPH